MSENLEVKLGKLEERVSSHGNRIKKVEDQTFTLERLATIVEMQVDLNRQQGEQMKEMADTLNEMNLNLSGLNNGLADLNERVTEIEDKNINQNINYLQQSVEKLDDRLGKIEERKIDWNKFVHSTSLKILGTIVTLGVLAWLANQFGWSFLK
ncbi:hypothetical protein [Robertmurraya siralis]|uniref:hypothetical protein n=1 Tax=Robertmurraya siralis TaxID=77777 RepID=UPI0010F439BB|nr:hypothetical protein [Robertmurraya siralis]